MKKGFTLVEILIVVAILGLLAAIGVPSFIGARQGAEANMMRSNIAAIQAAKDQFALLNNVQAGTPVAFSNIAPFIGNNITNLSQLEVGSYKITIGNIGADVVTSPALCTQ